MAKLYPSNAIDDDVQAEILSKKETATYFEDAASGRSDTPNHWAVFNSADNTTMFFSDSVAATKHRNDLFERYHGTGINPCILLLRVEECALVF